MSNPVTQQWKPCGLIRRFLSIFYDSVLLFSVLFFATALIMPFTGGAIASGNLLFQVYLLLCCYLYFCWQWVKGGQTLGMRAWRIRVICHTGENPGWKHATLRFLLAGLSWLPAGAGFLWALFDHCGHPFHDRFSHTRLVLWPVSNDSA